MTTLFRGNQRFLGRAAMVIRIDIAASALSSAICNTGHHRANEIRLLVAFLAAGLQTTRTVVAAPASRARRDSNS